MREAREWLYLPHDFRHWYCTVGERKEKQPHWRQPTAPRREKNETPRQARRRFMAMVKKCGSHWLWKGWKSGVSPVFRDALGQTTARRWAWLHIARRKLGKGRIVVPTCGEPDCISPWHAKPGKDATF